MSFNILSRVAERVYWLGRYLERADATARLITVHANLLMDLPMRLPLGWGRVVAIYRKFKLNERMFKFAHVLKPNSYSMTNSTSMYLLKTIADNDRQGQAAHRRCSQITYSS